MRKKGYMKGKRVKVMWTIKYGIKTSKVSNDYIVKLYIQFVFVMSLIYILDVRCEDHFTTSSLFSFALAPNHRPL